MRNFKRFLSLALALLMIFSYAPTIAYGLNMSQSGGAENSVEEQLDDTDSSNESEDANEGEDANEDESEPDQLVDPLSETDPQDEGDSEYWYDADALELVIDTAEELQEFAQIVNGTHATITKDTFAGQTVKLGATIDLTGIEWTPIGNDTNYFWGTFDGQGHTIKNMTINVNTPDANQFVGLFGGVRKATIKNLTIKDAKIDVVGAKVRAAAVVAIAHSNSENHTTANLNFENITVDGCVINAEAKSNSLAVGGLSGYCYPANMTNISVSNMTVNTKASSSTFAGGLVGYMQGQNISNNGNTRAYYTVDGFNLNKITIKSETNDTLAGGFAGYTYYGYITLKNGKINDFKVDVDVAKEALIGGLIGLAHRSDKGHTFTNVKATGIDFDITSDSGVDVLAGGMVGYSGSPIAYSDCSVSGTITETTLNDASSAIVGGFVGGTVSWAQSYTNCTADVDIEASAYAGGFVGSNGVTATYTDCEAKGTVEAPTAGGFAGYVYNDTATLVNCAYTGESDVPFIPGYVAQVGTTYYKTLAEAVTAANAVEGGTTITLLDNVTIGEQLTISGDVTIDGAGKNITWADGYTGTLLNVESDASVELKNLIIDGENAFTFYNDTTTVENGQNWYTRFVDVGEEDKAVNANVIVNAGDLTLNTVQIKNVTIASDGDNGKTENTESGYILKYNDDLAIIKSNGGTVELNGAEITGNAGMVLNAVNATTSITNSVIDGNMGCGNKGGIIIASGGTMALNDSSICYNKAMARSATVLGVINGAVVTMNGNTRIDNNKHLGVGSNTAGAIVVLEGASQFVMNGGSISNNVGGRAGAIASRWAEATAMIELNAGTITDNTASNDSWNGASVFLRSPATIGEGMEVEGTIAVNAAPGELDITGGTFTDFELIVANGLSAEISGGTFDADPSAWLAPNTGLVHDEATSTYGVTGDLYEYNGVAYKSFADVIAAIKNAPATVSTEAPVVKVLASHKIDKFLTIDVSLVLDLNGQTITRDGGTAIYVNGENITVTITGEGTVVSGKAEVLYVNEGTVKVENGTFTSTVDKGPAVYVINNGHAEIYGGTFSNNNGEFVLNEYDKTRDNTTITVYGGTFVGFNPANNAAEGAGTNFVAEGYEAKDNNDGTYTVEKVAVTIGSVEDLIAFGKAVTENTTYQGVKVAANPSVVVTLTADLNLENSGFAPIGNGAANAFSGTFDGQNHTISNMTLSCDYYRGVGFFRSLGKGAVVRNVTFVNAKIDNGDATAANHFYGVVAGFSNNLTLDNVDVKDSSVTCKYSGAAMVGCLEGATTIKNCDIENVTLTTTSIRVAVYGILGNSANGHTAALENNTVKDVVSIVNGEVKALKETLGYGEWNSGIDYAEASYVAQIGETKYSTLHDAVVAAEENDTITLIGDVKRVKFLTIDKSITLNLNGKTITRDGGTAIYVNGDDITVTITGEGTVVSGKAEVLYVNEGTVKVENGTFTSTVDKGPAVYVINNGHAEIYGGTFSNNNGEFVLNEYDKTRDNTTITVYGGTFVGFNPANNAAEGAGTNFVAKGYEAKDNGDGTWTVKQSYVEWVQEQLFAGNSVTLEKDIVITDYDLVHAHAWPSNGNGKHNEAHGNGAIFHIIKPGVVLDLNGHSITWDAHHDDYCNKRQVSLFMVTITGNTGETSDFTVKDSVGTGKVDVYGMGTGMYVVGVDATGTIEGGTWTNYPCKTCGASNIFLYPSHGGKLVISGGTFEQKDSEYLLGAKGSTKETTNNGVGTDYDATEIVISGGTFVGFNPEEVKFFDYAGSDTAPETIDGCELGSMAKNNGDGTYGIQPWDRVIRDTDDLIRFAKMANAGNTFSGKTVTLAADIDLGGMTWTPISKFSGTFDGGNHFISNFSIDGTSAHSGFFNVLEWATVKDLTLTGVTASVGGYRFGTLACSINQTNIDNITVENVRVTTTASTAFVAGLFCHGTVNSNMEVNNCTVENLTVNAEKGASLIGGITCFVQKNGTEAEGTNILENLHVKNFKVTINDTDGVAAVGGLVGQTQSVWQNPRFNDCSVSGLDVTATGKVDVGGFMCYPGSYTYAENCTAEGKIDVSGVTSYACFAGGFFGNYGWGDNVGKGNHMVTNCSADVDITTKIAAAGGFVGSGTNSEGRNKNITLTNCTASGDITCVEGGTADIGGFFGNADRGTYENCSASGKVTNNGPDNDTGYDGQFGGEIINNSFTVILDGCNATGTATSGKFIGNIAEGANVVKYVAKIGNVSYETLAEAIAEVKDGETITLLTDCDENVTIKQVSEKSFTIDGADKTYTGTITIDGSNRSTGAETLTIKNVNFVLGGQWQSGIFAKKSTQVHNVIIDGCSFTGTDTKEAYGIRLHHSHNIVIKNTTGTKLYDLVYGQTAVTGLTVENVTVTESGMGFMLPYGMKLSFKNVTLDVEAVGVGIYNYNASTATFENCTIKASTPIHLEQKNAANAYTLNFNGTNAFTSTNTNEGVWLNVIGNDATFKVVVNDTALDMTKTAGLVAKIGNIYYNTLQYAIKDAEDGETVVLVKDLNIANCEIGTLGGKYNTYFLVENKSITVNLDGKKIYGEYTGDSMLVGVFSTDNGGHLTLTGNGIVDVKATTTVYSMFANYTEGCSITIEDGTYKLDKASDSLLYTDGNEGIIVNGGTFTLDNVGTGSNGSPWIFNAKGQNTAHVLVNGGTFNANVNEQYYPFEVEIPKTHVCKNNGNGTWTVEAGSAVAYVNKQYKSGNWYTKEVGYATVAEALNAAAANVEDATKAGVVSTVTLIKDATENFVAVTEEITLDLNGYELAANYVTVFGNIVDNSEENTGRLNVPSTRFMVREDNAQLPVKTTEGYAFIVISEIPSALGSENTSYDFAFLPRFEADSIEMLKAGYAETGVKVLVRVSWTNSNGDTRSQDFVYGDEKVNVVLNSFANGTFGEMFVITINGETPALTYQAIVVSDTGVEIKGAAK